MSSLHFVRTLRATAWKMYLNGLRMEPGGCVEVIQTIYDTGSQACSWEWRRQSGMLIKWSPGPLHLAVKSWACQETSLGFSILVCEAENMSLWFGLVGGMNFNHSGKKRGAFIFKTESRSNLIRLISTGLIYVAFWLNWFIRVAYLPSYDGYQGNSSRFIVLCL